MSGYAPLRRPLLKAPYLLYQLFAAFFRVPFWALLAIPRAWRPRKSWSWGRTMAVKAIRHLELMQDKAGLLIPVPTHLALVSGIGYHGVWVEAVPQNCVIGKVAMWASGAGVSPVRLPGYWIHQPGSTIPLEAPLMPGEKVVYVLHGGAYTRLSAHPSALPALVAKDLIQHVERVHRTFGIEYRLSTTTPYAAEHPFPTALLDALTGYYYLVETLHISPADIVVMGDSAGANLAVALVRYLVENPIAALPPPGSLLLLSPWVDLGTSHDSPTSSLRAYKDSDFLIPPSSPPSNMIHYSILAFTGPLGLGAADWNPYISPASKYIADKDVSFASFPRTFISAGGAEILIDSIRTLHTRMARDMGDRVRYLEAADSVHDFLMLPGVQEPQRGETFAAIAEWITEA
ncbi:Abhydrolase-3 domain-containing protein [Mycena sanguinolenta]|uniref:Abhydrolase-3 domain-containing protein n=1 Tax=Mycena sanguinolenta TaxID=230812 RepID=A0A8H6XLN2_9AGAR|nr:Abhydrolase-3 domain-containing protein [Mycena sanguinolenta]